MGLHPATATWKIPARRAPGRVNLREMSAREDRFEHHLVVVARVGDAQLECATASEPLYFAHANVSDEYALMLPTGDPMLDLFQARTFVTDRASGADVARYRHGAFDLVLHPWGFLHWPGRLRPPYEVFQFGPGMRRRGLSLVACAARPRPPGERPLGAPAGREADVKRERDDVPVYLADTRGAATTAVVADATLELLVEPDRVAPPRGGYLVVLDADGAAFDACDLAHVPPGAALETPGVRRALLFSSATAYAEPPPPSWTSALAPPIPPYEDAAPGALPVELGPGLVARAKDERWVEVAGAEVPRYWLARFLFRVVLHELRLGYVETYGGFFVDDGEGVGDAVTLGVRGGPRVAVPRAAALPLVERLYRAVAPPGYLERI